MFRTPFSTKDVASPDDGFDTFVTTTTNTTMTKKATIKYPKVFTSLPPSLTFAHRLAQGQSEAMGYLFSVNISCLFLHVSNHKSSSAKIAVSNSSRSREILREER